MSGCDGSDYGDEGFDGPSKEVEILFDDRGIPHVYAANDEDLFYGGGYAIASMRLFQMDLLRRRGLGRWAEVAGPEHYQDDVISRVINFRDLAERDAEAVAREFPQAWALVEAWAAGINARIGEILRGDTTLPYGFAQLGYMPERWTGADVVLVSRLGFFQTSNTLENELLLTVMKKLYPDLFDKVDLLRPLFEVYAVPPEDRPSATALIAPELEPHVGARPDVPREALIEALASLRDHLGSFRSIGSNNWAVAGRFTSNGRPILCNDPHLPFEVPSVMVPVHLDSKSRGEGTMNVAGFSLVGSPGVSLGHNEHIGWAATTNFADVMDVWEVARTATGVRIGDREVAAVSRTERIAMKMPDGTTMEAMFDVFDVPDYGVILPPSIIPIPITGRGNAMLLNYTGFGVFKGGDSLLRLQRATSISELEAAVLGVPGLGFNFVGADAEGITYRVGQSVPDRGDPTDMQAAWLMMDGTDESSFWTGEYLDPDRLPHSRAEQRGYIATANNDPFGFTGDGRVDNDPWYYGALFEPGYRAKRIEDELARLTARGQVTAADMITLQNDAHSVLADELLPALEAALAEVDTSEELAEFRGNADLATLRTLLMGWDRQMRRDSAAALAFRTFLFELASLALEDDLGPLYSFAQESRVVLLKVAAFAALGHYEPGVVIDTSPEVALVASLDRAAKRIASRFGSVDPDGYTYGEIHGALFTHDIGEQYDVGFVPTDGAEDTINVSHGSYPLESEPFSEQWDAFHGPVFRTVMTFGEDGQPDAQVTFPLGASGDPADPHFRDSLDEWVEGTPSLFPFRRSEVEAAMERRVVLPPAD